MVSGDQYLHGPDPIAPLVLREVPPFLSNLGVQTRAIGVVRGDGKGERAQKQEGGEQVGDHLRRREGLVVW